MGNGRITKKENKYTQISNHVLRDIKLSYKAKGLYSVINSYLTIPNFNLYKTFLAKNCPEGNKAFNNIWKELKESNYLIMHKMQDGKGVFYYEYELLDERIQTPQKEGVDKADVDKAVGGKRGSIIIHDFNKTDLNNIYNNNTEKTEEQKDVVVNSSQIQIIIEKFKEKYKADLNEKHTKELIELKGFEHIENCITTYSDYIAGRTIGNLGGDFNKFCKGGYTKPVSYSPTPQHANFEQRDYGEDLFKKYSQNIK